MREQREIVDKFLLSAQDRVKGLMKMPWPRLHLAVLTMRNET